MKVRILAGLAGEPFEPGEILDLPDDKAAQMIREERAEPIAPKSARKS